MAISIFSLLEAVILTRALFVAADLNIAEHLALRPMLATEIASATGAEEKPMNRLMHYLELHGVFNRNEDQAYCLNDFSHTMCQNNPNSIKPFLLHDDETRWNCYGHLKYSITTGRAAFDNLYGTDYFSYLKEHKQLSERFNDAMKIISAQEDELIAQSIPFQKRVADIGGGVGQLINNIAACNDIDQGILFDLPEVVSQSEDACDHCIKIGGSFFEPISIEADIFTLKRILHDWDDESAVTILKNICSAMNPDSCLYILDGILDYSQNKKLLASIDLALLSIFQGCERTKAEFESIIGQAGLEIISIEPIGELICAIQCKKVA